MRPTHDRLLGEVDQGCGVSSGGPMVSLCGQGRGLGAHRVRSADGGPTGEAVRACGRRGGRRGDRGPTSIARRSTPCQAASVHGQSNQVLSEVLRAGRASTAGLSPLSTPDSILMCYRAGQLGAVGRTVTGLLLERGLPVRAMVRREDDRAAALRAAGAEVVVGDLLEPADVYRVVSGCRRVYFGMSVSAGYLEATVTMAAVARDVGVDALVNMSQMTVSQMSIQHTTPSRQQRQHWLGEQALAWSGLPVVTVRPTMFLETFVPLAGPAVRDRGRIELPFGRGKTSPVAAADVARVVAAVLADPGPHLGRIYELTGPRSQDMHGVAREFSDALNREVTYADIPPEAWERG